MRCDFSSFFSLTKSYCVLVYCLEVRKMRNACTHTHTHIGVGVWVCVYEYKQYSEQYTLRVLRELNASDKYIALI